jgi:pteridine reductase
MSPLPSDRAIANRPVALVTGAGRRVGNTIARELAAHGYRLVLHANASQHEATQTARELTAGGTDAIALAADLRDEAATRRLVRSAHEHFGRLDALVNNAALWKSQPLESVSADMLREHFEINTLATFICCQEAGLLMAAQTDGGAIVNVGDWAIARPYQDYAAYFVAKGAIPTLTRAMAVELAARNPRVRVNAVLPGPVLIPEESTREDRQAIVDATLVKREGTPVDLARAVIFLLENPFITGVCLPVDGGRSIFAPEAGD